MIPLKSPFLSGLLKYLTIRQWKMCDWMLLSVRSSADHRMEISAELLLLHISVSFMAAYFNLWRWVLILWSQLFHHSDTLSGGPRLRGRSICGLESFSFPHTQNSTHPKHVRASQLRTRSFFGNQWWKKTHALIRTSQKANSTKFPRVKWFAKENQNK